MSIATLLSIALDDLENMAKVNGDNVVINKGAYEAMLERLNDIFIEAANKENIPLALQESIDVSAAGANVIEFPRARFITKEQ